MSDKRYSAADFAKALKTKELSDAIPIELEGFIKPDDKDDKALQFSPYTCGAWVAIPLMAIEHIIDLGARRCKDHSHRYVRLQLKDSQSHESSLLRTFLAPSSTGDDEETYATMRTTQQQSNCQRACSICRRFPWKTGPCSVCNSDACLGDDASFFRVAGHRPPDDSCPQCDDTCAEYGYSSSQCAKCWTACQHGNFDPPASRRSRYYW